MQKQTISSNKKDTALTWYALFAVVCLTILFHTGLRLSDDVLRPVPPTPPQVSDRSGEIVSQDDVAPQSEEVSSKTPQTSQASPSPETTNKSEAPQASPINESDYISEKVLGSQIIVDTATYPLREYAPTATSSDPIAGQWWETEINIHDAWDIATGSEESVIAIIDTGFALEHEEFTNRWYENTAEEGPTTEENPSLLNCTDRSLPLNQSCNLIDDDFDGIVDNESGATSLENQSLLNCSDQLLPLNKNCNLVDDDGNGLVDDWRGWDFVNFDRSVAPGETNPFGTDTTHGTAVASTAAATGDNGVGIAGVNWRAKILPLQAIDDDGYGNSVSVARSIRYAVNQGADVINLSLGGAYPDSFLLQTIREAMKAGVVVVAASGNDGCNCISYPANYPEVIAVGALNQSRVPASFSSYGANLDVLAPGVNHITASWSQANPTSRYVSGVSGTSFATPLVSGMVALLKETLPQASTTELVALLAESADPLSINASSVRSDTLGFGTVDAFTAMQRASTPTELSLITSFQRVSHGAELFSDGVNADTSITVYQCELTTANTPLYKLAKGTHHFYTASLTEYVIARQNAYSSSLVGYMCVHYPHDTATTIRVLNLGLELENTLRKP